MLLFPVVCDFSVAPPVEWLYTIKDLCAVCVGTACLWTVCSVCQVRWWSAKHVHWLAVWYSAVFTAHGRAIFRVRGGSRYTITLNQTLNAPLTWRFCYVQYIVVFCLMTRLYQHTQRTNFLWCTTTQKFILCIYKPLAAVNKCGSPSWWWNHLEKTVN